MWRGIEEEATVTWDMKVKNEQQLRIKKYLRQMKIQHTTTYEMQQKKF